MNVRLQYSEWNHDYLSVVKLIQCTVSIFVISSVYVVNSFECLVNLSVSI